MNGFINPLKRKAREACDHLKDIDGVLVAEAKESKLLNGDPGPIVHCVQLDGPLIERRPAVFGDQFKTDADDDLIRTIRQMVADDHGIKPDDVRVFTQNSDPDFMLKSMKGRKGPDAYKPFMEAVAQKRTIVLVAGKPHDIGSLDMWAGRG